MASCIRSIAATVMLYNRIVLKLSKLKSPSQNKSDFNPAWVVSTQNSTEANNFVEILQVDSQAVPDPTKSLIS